MAKPDVQNVTADLTKDTLYVDPGKSSLSIRIFKAGTGTVGGGGTVTVTDVDAATTSKIFVSNTLNANGIAVTTKASGSFIVTGTGSDTFDYLITNV